VPEEAQVGDVAQAIAQTGELEKKLAQSAETLAQVNAALALEIEKRVEVTRRLEKSEALVDALLGSDDPEGEVAR
jgi:phage-related minor tail protein